jgi:hypothetical protein
MITSEPASLDFLSLLKPTFQSSHLDFSHQGSPKS